jgi:hypothetical protein
MEWLPLPDAHWGVEIGEPPGFSQVRAPPKPLSAATCMRTQDPLASQGERRDSSAHAALPGRTISGCGERLPRRSFRAVPVVLGGRAIAASAPQPRAR